MRSMLFVPADSPRKLARACESGADALILDLEDSIAPPARESARAGAAAFLSERGKPARRQKIFVRVNALDSGLADLDLDAIMSGQPDGIVLPKARGGQDVQHLGAKLAVREAENDLPDSSTIIIPIVTETAGAIFALGSYAGASRRTGGLAWGAEDLSAAVGAERTRTPDGAWASPWALARNLTLFAATSAGVDAIDTIYASFRDEAGLRAECETARRDGFSAKMAIHPGQVPIINEAFTPATAAIVQARTIVEAFARNESAGVVSIAGEMFDRPHLRRAQRLLARAPAAKGRP